ncbi:MAG: transcription antitermination protein NusB [Crocinitomicaceae bacterium]|jgi:transcription antitermination protein NusB|nr:transcription antitermination protein NusB [Crocinitomicaceae bacterium]MDP4866129.1 transcription antitermination protein NusB [Crocinitomicaceae bacterium]MDP5011765.1 transcription antitermination protein NusB [Crocinitomicaceae bacterium]
MLNRRHLRIKVLQALYAYFQSNDENYRHTENELMQSVERIYDLYISYILTFPELKGLAEHRMDESKKKMRPTEEDLNPNLKFVDNKLIALIEESKELRRISEERKVNWVGDEHQEMLRKILLTIRESEVYIQHMNDESRDFESDKMFVLDLFKAEIANSEIFYNYLEEKSIHWMDDIDLTCSMVLKTLKQAVEGEKLEILPLYKPNDDEQEFIRELLRKTISLNSENEKLIDDLTQNWELDRIAKMDIILMKMAITELQIFNNIPTKVTLNEYIEISKFYSTPKSNGFINGILDKAIDRLTADKKIKKIGRGLVN